MAALMFFVAVMGALFAICQGIPNCDVIDNIEMKCFGKVYDLVEVTTVTDDEPIVDYSGIIWFTSTGWNLPFKVDLKTFTNLKRIDLLESPLSCRDVYLVPHGIEQVIILKINGDTCPPQVMYCFFIYKYSDM
jgi:hypothetical protein